MLRVRAFVEVLLAILILALAGHTVAMAVHQMPVHQMEATETSAGHAPLDHDGSPLLAMALGSCFAILAATAALKLRRSHMRVPVLRLVPIPSGPVLFGPIPGGRPPPRTGTILRP